MATTKKNVIPFRLQLEAEDGPARINPVANDDEKCSSPVELAEIQNRLFL